MDRQTTLTRPAHAWRGLTMHSESFRFLVKQSVVCLTVLCIHVRVVVLCVMVRCAHNNSIHVDTHSKVHLWSPYSDLAKTQKRGRRCAMYCNHKWLRLHLLATYLLPQCKLQPQLLPQCSKPKQRLHIKCIVV